MNPKPEKDNNGNGGILGNWPKVLMIAGGALVGGGGTNLLTSGSVGERLVKIESRLTFIEGAVLEGKDLDNIRERVRVLQLIREIVKPESMR